MTAQWITADVFDGLATLETGSVDLVVTSPPFLALRSYLPADHPDKGKEIGSEATPAEFIDVLLRVTAELRRVLAPHGSICVELGDTYAGSSMSGGDDATNDRYPAGRSGATYGNGRTATKGTVAGWPLAKSRTLIPQLYEIALAYGINPLTGNPSPAGQWRIRNVVTWARPNPPVGALGDKWRPATSDLIVACTSPKRYWDDLATRKPHKAEPSSYTGNGYSKGFPEGIEGNEIMPGNPSGAPLLDYWEIPPGGYKGSHYAVFPEELVVPCVKAMCPEKVCDALVCGHCGHNEPGFNRRYLRESLEAGEQQLPISTPLQEELRRVWGVLRGPEPIHLFSEMSVGAQERDLRTPREHLETHGGVGADQPSGLHQSVEEGSSEGGEGLRPGASPSDGGTSGPISGVVGTRPPQERDQERQPAREPGDRAQHGPPRADYLSELRDRILRTLTCPKCERDGFGVCGEPSRRIVEREAIKPNGSLVGALEKSQRRGVHIQDFGTSTGHDNTKLSRVVSEEWTNCGHDDWRPGLVLDCFAGSGTTLSVATGHGHDAVGIDLDPRNADLARDRIGPFLFEEVTV